MRLENKVAIITGGGSGMGEAAVRLFAKEGAKVVATDINLEAAEKVAQEVRSAGFEAVAMKQNVADKSDWQSVISQTVETFGKIDVLVNNAGISVAKDFLDQTE